LVILTEKAEQHLAIAGRTLHALESELATAQGAEQLDGLRRELGRLIGALAGDDVPPLRPVW